jgi:hypothetical protein
MDDWRLCGQERYLKGVSLIKRQYEAFRQGWDHDHCEFCGLKFSDSQTDLKIGYVTLDNYHWICLNCFKDFNGLFQWNVVGSNQGPSRPSST